ncbi:similar to Saccharomyces cerevisiae YOR131C Putative protein of unknown function [Maudiozyma saulgeensis]|uniref:Uncharacterized protein n=1 Tax=Maudiozyma saulgeensis TaxID=1789683 RepID=A0A1X7QXG0_9SACH|nr:similar to Saccharomyces cerevisiae YOR131C Putative protein of unknown function [Kazachstania saulgeensis]
MSKFSSIKHMRSIKALVFDMDGTLCLPQPWMFPAMRKAIGLEDKSIDILKFIDDMPTEVQRAKAREAIHGVEEQAMIEMEPQPGLRELMGYLTTHSYSKSICTRNVITPVNYFVSKFIPVGFNLFDYSVTRDFRPTKPYPDPLLYISRELGIDASEMMMVGDSMDDMRSGRSAGCITILLKNHVNGHIMTDHKDLVDYPIDNLSEIITILEKINI